LRTKTSFTISNIFETISIRKYDGRIDDVYKIKNTDCRIFAFVIDGAFAVQNRMMQAIDGLALWNVDEKEFEASSNEATIVFMECEM